jgi:hypothetical protein
MRGRKKENINREEQKRNKGSQETRMKVPVYV